MKTFLLIYSIILSNGNSSGTIEINASNIEACQVAAHELLMNAANSAGVDTLTTIKTDATGIPRLVLKSRGLISASASCIEIN